MSLLELSLVGGERLAVHRFSVREAVSSLFVVEVLARSPDPCVDLAGLLGQPAALRIVEADRAWCGVCSHARLVQAVDLGATEVGLSTYEITIVPRLWLLTQRAGYRVFQDRTIPEIAADVLSAWGIEATFRVDEGTHPRLVYKVQYGETDFAFLSRLLEEAGIAYAFSNDDDSGSRLLLNDALHATAPHREAPIVHIERLGERAPNDFVTRVSIDERVRAGAVTLRDHDFQRPVWPLFGDARGGPAIEGSPSIDASLERYVYQPGAFLVQGGAPGSHHDDDYGALLAARALEGARADACVVSFETNAADLQAGTIVSVEGHVRPELDPRAGLLITSVSIEGSPHGDWAIRATGVPATIVHRPARRTTKPSVAGVQSAIVIGPEGQEIHTDEHGRVRVQFPWDREAQGSCWLRVAQGWAGAGLGMFVMPRVGQEVLVAFLEGDPDQPIVVGRVSNALNPPPLKLPEERTQSIWRSTTTPGGGGFNEIKIEDRRGAELVAIRAERDMAVAVGHHRAKVVAGNETARVEGKTIVYVGEDAHITIEGELRERIGGKRSLTVEGDLHGRVGGDVALEAVGQIHLRAGAALVLEGGDVTLRGPGGFVRIDGSGVSIDGSSVRIKEGGAPGVGKGADPALPVIPLRADQERAPRRLPLLAFPQPTMPRGRSGGGGPLTPSEVMLCGVICSCKIEPAPNVRPSDCVTRKLRVIDAASGGTSKLKAEVPYDMTTNPPTPIMSRNHPGPRQSKPKGSKVPDVVVVKDPTKPPTQDNIEKVIEIKFPPDRFTEGQEEAYEKIAGGAPFEEFGPERCGCPDGPPPPPVPVRELAEATLLALLLVLMILDDAAPGGQADDPLIPPVLARLLSKLAPLLRGPAFP